MGYNGHIVLWVNSIDVLLVVTLGMDPLLGYIDATTVVIFIVIVVVADMVTFVIFVKALIKHR